jgi:hypothetical protein
MSGLSSEAAAGLFLRPSRKEREGDGPLTARLLPPPPLHPHDPLPHLDLLADHRDEKRVNAIHPGFVSDSPYRQCADDPSLRGAARPVVGFSPPRIWSATHIATATGDAAPAQAPPPGFAPAC